MPAERPQGIAPLYVSRPSLRKQKVPISPTGGGNLPLESGTLLALSRPAGRSLPSVGVKHCYRVSREGLTPCPQVRASARPSSRTTGLTPPFFLWTAAACRFSSRSNATSTSELAPQPSSVIPKPPLMRVRHLLFPARASLRLVSLPNLSQRYPITEHTQPAILRTGAVCRSEGSQPLRLGSHPVG